MTVLQVAYPFAPFSLDAAGGAEQVMAVLDRALVSGGHEAIAIACEGSKAAGALLPVQSEQRFDYEARKRVHQAVRKRISQAVNSFRIDLIHMHGVDFHEYLPQAEIPVLATLHLPVSSYPDTIFEFETYLNCVSEAQRNTCPGSEKPRVIENGIPLDLIPTPQATKQNYAVALGRICPEKGFHLAVEAAAEAGVPLMVAGAVFPYDAHRQYFQEQLLPLLLPPHRHLGPVDFERKIRLLAGAKCLLVPSVAAETSSLVTMEALACGTPVIAFRSGALPELIDDGRTGFLVRNAAEMASAIGRTKEINSQECRREAERRFSANRMANDYFEYYVQIAAGKSVKVQRVAELRARSNTRQHFAIRCAPPGNL